MKYRRLVLALAVALGSLAIAVGARAACGTPPAMSPLTFSPPVMVDTVRAGGEPSIQPMPDGTLIYAAHGGTTHLYRNNAADLDWEKSYQVSEYFWRSEDNGVTWTYIGLDGGDSGPSGGIGFSDPTTDVDLAGNVYVAGTHFPVNLWVSKSSDSGKHWTSNSIAGFTTDRPWLAADEEDVVYMIAEDPRRGRILIETHDGGETWNWAGGLKLPHSYSPIIIDKSDGRLYYTVSQAHMALPGIPTDVLVFPNLRNGDHSFIRSTIAGGLPNANGFLSASALDAAGNVYVTSNTERSVRISTSTDRGLTWTTQTIRTTARTVMWPWVAAGSDGRVAVTWFERYSDGWRVWSAQSITAHGWTDECGVKQPPVWQFAQVTAAPFHKGEICGGGLGCQTSTGAGSDRRLGDYFTSAIDASGHLVIAYSNTANKPSGMISHPAFVRQSGGTLFRE